MTNIKSPNVTLRLGQKLLVGLACVWFFLASLAPDVSLAGPLKARPEDAVTALLAALLLSRIILNGRIRRTVIELPFGMMLAGFGFGFIGLFAILVSVLSGIELSSEGTFGYNIQVEIFKEFVRFFKYILVAVAFANVPFRAWKPVLATLAACCIVIVGIQVLQYLDVDIVSKVLKILYKPGQNWSAPGYKDIGHWRSGSVMVQPNVMGAYLIAPQLLFLMLFIQSVGSSSHENKRYRLLWLCLSGIVFVGIFMTQSLTALFAMSFGAIVGFLHIPRDVRRRLYRYALWIAIFIVLVCMVFGSSLAKHTPNEVVRQINESLGNKAHITLVAIDQLGLRILVGAGPANSIFVDNEFGYIIAWYGITGLLVYYVFYGFLYSLSIRRIKNIYLRSAFVGTIAAFIIGAVANSFLLCNRVFPVFIALLTLACNKTISIRRTKLEDDGLPLQEISGKSGLVEKNTTY